MENLGGGLGHIYTPCGPNSILSFFFFCFKKIRKTFCHLSMCDYVYFKAISYNPFLLKLKFLGLDNTIRFQSLYIYIYIFL